MPRHATAHIPNVANNLKKAIIILILTIFSACEKPTEIENPNGIFTQSDINELNLIITEFDNILKKEYSTNNTEEAYLDYSKEFWRNLSEEQTGYIPIPNGMELLGKKVQNLKVFDKIWSIWKDKSKDNEVYNIGPKPYLTYLKARGKKSDFIKGYAESLSAAGDIMPSVMAGFARNIGNLDLKNKNNRLIFAVHYLTLINR